MDYHCMKKKNLFSNDVKCYTYMVGWQWNHGLMLWWRFHCMGKYVPRINNPWPSDPCAVLKHQPTDSLWMGSSEVSSSVRISSVGYYLVASIAAANCVEARDLPT